MTEAAKQARNAYMRLYYATHKEQRQEYNRAYWERKAAQQAAEQPLPAPVDGETA